MLSGRVTRRKDTNRAAINVPILRSILYFERRPHGLVGVGLINIEVDFGLLVESECIKHFEMWELPYQLGHALKVQFLLVIERLQRFIFTHV